MAAGLGPVTRRIALLVSGVDVASLAEQQPKHLSKAASGR